MKIQVLGMGCPRCKVLFAEAAKAVKASGIQAELEKVETLEDILASGVMATPALVIDGDLKCVGRVPPAADILRWITAAAAGAGADAGRGQA